MKSFLVGALATIGTILGTIGTSACVIAIFDEPEMPDSLQ